MSGVPVISVIMVTFNAADELRDTLDSIAIQDVDFALVEFLVIDGMSADGTVAIAKANAFVGTIVSEPDAGIYDAMNKGARLARGTWIHFLNAGDTLASVESLRNLVQSVQSADRGGRFWFVGGARNLAVVGGAATIKNIPHRWWRHAYGVQPHCHQSTLFRRDIFVSLGGHSLDFSFVGDFDVILRFGLLQTPAQDARVFVNYLGGGLSDKRGSEIPGLQRRVRASRMQLNGLAVVIDVLLAGGARVRNTFALRVGRARVHFRRSRGASGL